MRWRTWEESWLKSLLRFGSSSSSAMTERARLRDLVATLDRQRNINALGALVESLDQPSSQFDIANTALGIDANIFLKLSNHPKSADIVDYLSTHDSPLILPGQAIQEFWNNQLQAVETVAKSLEKKFNALKVDLDKFDEMFEDFSMKFRDLLDQFSSEHGYIYDPSTVQKTAKLLEILQEKAGVTYAPRGPFHAIGEQRKATKTPPGFKDQGHGDFFIWVDYLFGLQEAKSSGQNFDRAVLVTNDGKIDWVREGRAHPILVAEMRALLNVPFEIWSLDTLAQRIGEA